MAVVNSFPPITNPDATILILGSMPGVASLAEQQYYAHPRNAFWTIIEAVLKIDKTLAYTQRVKALQQTHVALWDVLQQCERPGSLDSAIKKESRYPNDFATFFGRHTKIKTIVFNGGEAEKSFRQTVLPDLENTDALTLLRAPSTSPAYTLALEEKLQQWQLLLNRK